MPRHLIYRYELPDDTSDFVRFDGIPQYYGLLTWNIYGRSTRNNAEASVDITCNGDAVVGSYTRQQMYGAGGVVAASRGGGAVRAVAIIDGKILRLIQGRS